MKTIPRNEAIELLVIKELFSLMLDERESLLLNWWGIDEEDSEFHELPMTLRNEILESELPNDPSLDQYNPLLKIALSHRYRGIRNDYVEYLLYNGGFGNYSVVGIPEKLLACPCCHYLTLTSRGEYEVCRVCFWEDDGILDFFKYSSVNRMTLMEAKNSFDKHGAISLKSKDFVDLDGKKKWEKS